MAITDKELITKNQLIWAAAIFLAVASGISVSYINPVYIIVGLLMLVNIFFIIKNPFWGLLCYLFVLIYRPGEVYSALAPVRLKLVLGVLVLVLIVVHQKIKFGKLSLPADKITLTLLAFLFIMLLSVFSSFEKTETLLSCKEFVKVFIFYFLIISLVTTRKKFIAFISLYCLMIGKIAFDAFYSYFSGNYITTMGIDRIYGQTSAGGDPNALAATMAITIPIVFASGIYFKNLYLKFSLFALSLAMVTLIAITGSRGGLLAFVGILIGGFIYTKHKAIALVAVALLIVGGWFVLPEQYQDRYLTMFNVEEANQTSSGRLEVWRAGAKMIVDRPLLGVGAGAFSWAAGSGSYGISKYIQAHNLVIQIAATTGIFGLMIWLFFLYNFVARLKQIAVQAGKKIKGRWASVYSKAFVVSLIALFIAGLFGHNLYRYNWYMLAALTLALGNILNNEKETTVNE